MKLAYNCYKNYNAKYPLEDLIVEAKLGAINAVRSFDPTRNVKLITHIHNYINFSMSKHIRRDTGVIKIPRTKSKKENVIIPELIDNEIFLNNYVNEKCPEKFSFENNSENEIIFDELISILTEKEQNIIRLAFVERHTYAEIAQMYNVSRQYANTTANRALKKIKEKFFEIS
jgi:RNA polymerase sigma factor (sigma-70 family)